MLRSACVMCILFCFSLSCLSVFLFAPLLGRCLLADSTANHHSDVMMSANLLACQLYLRTQVDCVWVCLACVPCAPTNKINFVQTSFLFVISLSLSSGHLNLRLWKRDLYLAGMDGSGRKLF